MESEADESASESHAARKPRRSDEDDEESEPDLPVRINALDTGVPHEFAVCFTDGLVRVYRAEQSG